MDGIQRSLFGLRRRLVEWLATGFDMMARYPYDINEDHWHTYRSVSVENHRDDEPDASLAGTSVPPRPPATREIKIVPPPSAQNHRGARTSRIRASRRSRRRRQPA